MASVHYSKSLTCFVAVLLFIHKQTVSGSGSFQIHLNSLRNIKHEKSNGECCDGRRTIHHGQSVCSDECDTFFRVCLSKQNTQHDSSTGPCMYGEFTTVVLRRSSISFTNTSLSNNGFRNPISIHLSSLWKAAYSLVLEARDADNSSNSELIDRVIQRGRLLSNKEWELHAYNSSVVTISYKIRVICDADYYGNRCKKFCLARNDNSGHYTCDKNGNKICLFGWRGERCDTESENARLLRNRRVADVMKDTTGAKSTVGRETILKINKLLLVIKPQLCHPNDDSCSPGPPGPPRPKVDKGSRARRGKRSPKENKGDQGSKGSPGKSGKQGIIGCNPCQNNGSCSTNASGHYSCHCRSGWTGKTCNTDIDECSLSSRSPCDHGGTCVNTPGSFSCQCIPGYTGPTCIDQCYRNPCQNNGKCSTDAFGHFSCHCSAGWTGKTCNTDKDECSLSSRSPCDHGGTCVNTPGSFSCQCIPGYTGERCEVQISECGSSPCQNDAMCLDLLNRFLCICNPGWTGERCEVEINECGSSPCQNDAMCLDLLNRFLCVCNPGWTGPTCKDSVNDCSGVVCKNGSTCIDGLNTYYCNMSGAKGEPDVSAANNFSLECEIRESCSRSSECLVNQITVDPNSNVNLNCSIKTGRVTRGINWRDLTNDGMVLQQNNSAGGNERCQCTSIYFARKVTYVHNGTCSGSPKEYTRDSPTELCCAFRGWPLPRISWRKTKPDSKRIVNGSDGFSLSEKVEGNDRLRSFLRISKSKEKHEGEYECIAESSMPGWPSPEPVIFELSLQCPSPKKPEIPSRMVTASASSKASLICLVEIDPDGCADSLELQWRHFRFNSSVLIKGDKKYEIQEKKTDTKCKIQFILTINNVTKDDEAKYSCNSVCRVGPGYVTSATIELTVEGVPTTSSDPTVLSPDKGTSSPFNVGLAVGLCLGILSLVTCAVIGTLWYKKSRRSKKEHVIEPPSGMTARNSMGEEIDAMSTPDHKDNRNGIIDSVQEERRVQLLGDTTEISSVSRPSAGQVCVDKSKQRFHTSVLPSPTPVDMPAKITVEPSKSKAGKMHSYNIGKDSTCIGQENALHGESILLKEKEESWEIDLDRLRVSDVVLGEGEFGIVNKGSYQGKDVAVKQLKDGTSMADKNDLLSEIKMLKQAGRHPNIVSLVGVCTREEKILVVTELVPYGSLKNFLISKRVACVSGEASRYVNVRFGLNDRALLKIAFQIALGMQFLEKKKCVHRDLSARNVFIGENLVAKVGDFGLARDISDYGIYTKISSGRVPWRWLSLESLKAQVYTAKSDVWSYGIVLWEIATYGEEPYPNIETPRDLILWLSMGNRMSRPEHSSEKLYEIMCLCWKENPLMRPTFADITKRFPDCLQTYKNNYMNILKEDDRSVSEVSLLDGVSLSRTGNMTTTV